MFLKIADYQTRVVRWGSLDAEAGGPQGQARKGPQRRGGPPLLEKYQPKARWNPEGENTE